MPLLPLPDFIAQALRLCWNQRRTWFDVALVPIIISFLLGVLVQPLILGDDFSQRMQASMVEALPSLMIYMVLALIPWAAFAVGWTRFTLIGPPGAGGPAGLSWSMRETRYVLALGKMLGLYFAIFLVIGMLLNVLGIAHRLSSSTALTLGMLSLVAAGYALSRVALILPAEAVDVRLGLRAAWQYSRGNGWRLFGLLALLLVFGEFVSLLAGSIVAWLLTIAFGRELSLGPRVVAELVFTVLAFAATAPMITAMALAFRYLTGWREDGSLRPLASQPASV